jgi:hypothetical protein
MDIAVGPSAASSRIIGPVFLHTSWRTVGTWLWSRFRMVEGTRCFYEPLHEELATLSRDDIARLRPDNWPSGHPDLTRPYYDEYADLLNADGIGVQRYHDAFAIDQLLCPPETRLPDLRAYLDALIAAAEGAGTVPVLKFCRSMGRSAWMRRNFPHAVHITVMRNPASQWSSARRQYLRHDNPYFVAAPLRALASNRRTAQVVQVADAMGVQLPKLAGHDLAEDLALCTAEMARLTPEAAYRTFLAFWLLNALSGTDGADMVIDTDLLALSSTYRDATREGLATLTGIELDLDTVSQECAGLSGSDSAVCLGLEPRQILRCHADAQRVLLNWDRQEVSVGLVRASAMLSFASLLGTPEGAVLRAAGVQWLPEWDGIVAEAHQFKDRLQVLERRAKTAESELSALRNSHSWMLTAPLRVATVRIRSLLGRPISVGGEAREALPH